MIAVVMGVAGSGKTTVGRALAAALGCGFLDADDFHSAAHVEQMRRGEPLTDADRGPWLDAVHAALVEVAVTSRDAVVACSALRVSYRRRLAEGLADVHWVYLRADRTLLESRLRTRPGHFAGLALLDSQLATLEEPDEAIVIAADLEPGQQVAQIIRRLGRPVP